MTDWFYEPYTYIKYLGSQLGFVCTELRRTETPFVNDDGNFMLAIGSKTYPKYIWVAWNVDTSPVFLAKFWDVRKEGTNYFYDLGGIYFSCSYYGGTYYDLSCSKLQQFWDNYNNHQIIKGESLHGPTSVVYDEISNVVSCNICFAKAGQWDIDGNRTPAGYFGEFSCTDASWPGEHGEAIVDTGGNLKYWEMTTEDDFCRRGPHFAATDNITMEISHHYYDPSTCALLKQTATTKQLKAYYD